MLTSLGRQRVRTQGWLLRSRQRPAESTHSLAVLCAAAVRPTWPPPASTPCPCRQTTDGFSGLNGGWDTPGTGMNFLVHNMVRQAAACKMLCSLGGGVEAAL